MEATHTSYTSSQEIELDSIRLPKSCIKEVEQICSAFLWTGPVLKATNAKVAWKEICYKKNEGGLGIRNLREVNRVFGLKLIWRMLSGASLWGNWIHSSLLKGKSFWEVSINMQTGSWMWRKMLKLRELAKSFYKKEIGNGRHTSFWFDNWSDKGVLADVLGDRGIIDMGIRKCATVEDAVLSNRRRRRHRTSTLNEIEAELSSIERALNLVNEDICLWRRSSGYKQRFSTQETWELMRECKSNCAWASGIWFAHATPKYSFMAWLAIRNRLSTMDRVAKWNLGIDETCVLCKAGPETRDHLFFGCSYTGQLWEYIAKGILGSSFTAIWDEIISIITDRLREKKSLFCIRYAFQVVLYAVWRERNKIRHGDRMMPLPVLKRVIEKGIRNRLSLLCTKKTKGMEELLQFWFITRI